jgi:hypothetical protein
MKTFGKCCMELLDLIEPITNTNIDFAKIIFTNGRIAKGDYNYKLNMLIHHLFDEKYVRADYSKKYIKDNYSKITIKRKISRFLSELETGQASKNMESIEQFFDIAPDCLFSPPKTYSVIRRIENLSIDSEIAIGNVVFLKYSLSSYKKILETVGNNKQVENNKTVMDLFLEHHDDENVNCVAITCAQTGEIDKALEKVDAKIDDALSVFRLYVKEESNFGIKGTINSYMTSAIFDIQDEGLGFSLKHHNDFLPTDINSDFLTYIKKNGFDNIKRIIDNEDLHQTKINTLEELLIRAIRAFGFVIKNPDNPDNIIKLFTALETLLIRRDEKIDDNLGERVGLVNYSLFDISDETEINKITELREQAKLRIIDCYGKRSDLVHAGKFDVDEPDYRSVIVDAKLCIINIAKIIDEYPTYKGYIDVIDKGKKMH